MKFGIISGACTLLCAAVYLYLQASDRDRHRHSSGDEVIVSEVSHEREDKSSLDDGLQATKAVTIEIPPHAGEGGDRPPNFAQSTHPNRDDMHLSKDGPLGDMWVENPPSGGPPADTPPGKMILFNRIQEAMPDAYFPEDREPADSLSGSNPVGIEAGPPSGVVNKN